MTTDPCSEIVRNLHQILEDDSHGSLCDTVRAHLEICASCREQREAMEDLVEICRRFPEERIPEEVKRRMKENLKRILFGEKNH